LLRTAHRRRAHQLRLLRLGILRLKFAKFRIKIALLLLKSPDAAKAIIFKYVRKPHHPLPSREQTSLDPLLSESTNSDGPKRAGALVKESNASEASR